MFLDFFEILYGTLADFLGFEPYYLLMTLVFGGLFAFTFYKSWECRKTNEPIGCGLPVLNVFFAIAFLWYFMWFGFLMNTTWIYLLWPTMFAILLVLIIFHMRKRKKEAGGIGRLLPILSVFVSLCFVFHVFCFSYWCYITHPETELYRDETYDGHEFVIYEKGHPIFYLGNYHDLVVELNGEAMLQFVVQYHKDDLAVVPADIIVCKTDSVTDYTVEVYGAIMHFSADFQTIYELDCYETEILVDGLEIVHWEKRFFDLF